MKTEHVLFVWQHDTMVVLECHGERVGELITSKLVELLGSCLKLDDAPGVYLAMVQVTTVRCPAGDYGLTLNGTARLATADELRAFDEFWRDLTE